MSTSRPPRPEDILARLAPLGIRLGLDAPRRLFAALDHPETRFPAVLVAGTNGKGSTAAMIAAIVGAVGYRTGLFTSPPVETVEECVRVDGRSLPRDRLSELLSGAVAAADRAHLALPTPFEALTAAAFRHFADAAVDLAVVEVGMGGARDVTNLAEPLVSLVTSVGLDHQAWLGQDLASIAREKSGVFRPGRRAIVPARPPEALEILRREAASRGAALVVAEEAASLTVSGPPETAGRRIEAITPGRRCRFRLPLAGEHQTDNARMAVLAVEGLAAVGYPELDAAAVERGMASVRLPGRLEEVPLPGGAVLLDGAHNPQGIDSLERYLAARGEGFDLLFGALADKPAAAMLPRLATRARRVVLTRPPGPRPAWTPGDLRSLLPDGGRARGLDRLDAALDAALAPSPALLVVAGSLYLVGGVRRRLRQRFGVPPPTVETDS